MPKRKKISQADIRILNSYTEIKQNITDLEVVKEMNWELRLLYLPNHHLSMNMWLKMSRHSCTGYFLSVHPESSTLHHSAPCLDQAGSFASWLCLGNGDHLQIRGSMCPVCAFVLMAHAIRSSVGWLIPPPMVTASIGGSLHTDLVLSLNFFFFFPALPLLPPTHLPPSFCLPFRPRDGNGALL